MTSEPLTEILDAELSPNAWAKIQTAGANFCDHLEKGTYQCKVEKVYIQPVGTNLLLCIRLLVAGGDDAGKTLSKVYDLTNEETLSDLGTDLVTIGMDVGNMLPSELEDACADISRAHPVVHVAFVPLENPREKPMIHLSRERFETVPEAPQPPVAPEVPVNEVDPVVTPVTPDALAETDVPEDEDIVPEVGKEYMCVIKGRGRTARVTVTDVDPEEQVCTVIRASDKSVYEKIPFSRFDSEN